MTFSGLEELNTAVRVSLLDFNEKVMAGREVSRKEMFLQGEKDYLRPLPVKRYVMKREEADDCREELLRLVVQAPLQRSEGVCRQAHDDSL